jgi:hypothetical protein
MSSVKKAAVIGIIPGFALRRLDPNVIVTRYREGFYRTLAMPSRVALRAVAVRSTNVVSNHGQTPEDQVYHYRDKNNVNQTILTTNHVISVRERTPPYTCDFCRYTFTHEGIGVPVRLCKKTGVELEVITDGDCCSFECTLSQIRRFYPNAIRYKDPQYIDSEQLLKYLHRACHPDAPTLREAKDPRLLTPNGPMTREEWLADAHTYCRIPNLVVIPMKAQYLQGR